MQRDSFRMSESSQTSSSAHLYDTDPEYVGLEEKEKGCYVTKVWGFIGVLAALALAAVVGLIVGLAHPDRNKQCEVCVTVPPSDQPPVTTALPTQPPVDIRLPAHLVPRHYNLRLRPNIYGTDVASFGFTGRVEVHLECQQATRAITLHHRDLDIDSSQVEVVALASGQSVGWDRVQSEEATEFYIIHLSEDLVVGQMYSVQLAFSGPITADLAGLFLSSYQLDGDTRYLMASQFATTDARAAFPCMDEPALKATFNTILERRTHYSSWSNTDIYLTEALEDDWVADHYTETPAMSTYILAFVVADFFCNATYTTSGKLVEVCARPNAIQQVEFAASFAADMQTWFEFYHNVSYPMPKTTHMAIPDFGGGAMENWGCIIYRETALLYDPQASNSDQRQRVAVIVSHELAHMWFGNLVTPSWWDDIWLNEGFASFMEDEGVSAMDEFADWNMEQSFLVEKLQNVFMADSLTSSHPVFQPANHPDELNQIFDAIAYDKGASVIRQMRYFLGDATFRWGMSNYLKEKAYQAAHHSELFDFLTQQAESDGKDIDVGQVMDTWILQMGYPVVNCDLNRGSNTVQLTQKYFLIDPNAIVPDDSPYDYVWRIPVSVVTETQKEWDNFDITWLNTQAGSVSDVEAGAWIICNAKQAFYYRVNYDENNWRALIDQLINNHQEIHVLNRAQLVDDSFNLARAREMDQELSLGVTQYLRAERDYAPWVAAIAGLDFMDRMIAATGDYGFLKSYVQDIIEPTYQELGWGDAGNGIHIQERLRSTILDRACHYGLADCLAQGTQLYEDWMGEYEQNNTNSLDSNIRRTVYCTGVQAGGESQWQFAYERFSESNSGAEISNLLYALACTRQDWLLRRYLELAFAEEDIRRQDFSTVISYVARNSIGRPIAWQMFVDNWTLIFERFGTSPFSMSSIVSGVTESFSTNMELNQVQTFVASVEDLGSASNAFAQAVENIRSNIDWRQNNFESVITWLEENSDVISPTESYV